MRIWLTAIAAALALCVPYCAYAQAPTARVVTTCPGTSSFAVPGPGTLTVDINGTLCSSGGGGLTGNLGNNVDNVAPVTTGNVGADSYEYVFDGTSWQRAQPVNAGTAGVPGTDVLTTQPPLGTGSTTSAANSTPVVQGFYVSAGAGQYALSIASIQTLTVPAGSLIAQLCVEAASARYTTTGTNPSSTVGIPIASGACFQLSGNANLTAFKVIGAGATLDVEYFK